MMSQVIIVGFDATPGAHAALLAAIELARALHSPIVAVHVEHTPALVAAGASMGPGGGAILAAEDDLAELCRTECTGILGPTDLHWGFQVRHGDPADELIHAASENRAAFIVVGRHGHHGLGRLLAGSVSQHLVNHADHPVVVIPTSA